MIGQILIVIYADYQFLANALMGDICSTKDNNIHYDKYSILL